MYLYNTRNQLENESSYYFIRAAKNRHWQINTSVDYFYDSLMPYCEHYLPRIYWDDYKKEMVTRTGMLVRSETLFFKDPVKERATDSFEYDKPDDYCYRTIYLKNKRPGQPEKIKETLKYYLDYYKRIECVYFFANPEASEILSLNNLYTRIQYGNVYTGFDGDILKIENYFQTKEGDSRYEDDGYLYFSYKYSE